MEQRIEDKKREDEAIVLDFLPNGYSDDTRPSHLKNPIAQAIGKTNLALLELIPRKDIFLQPYEEVYVGDGKRDKIHHVACKIPITKLTMTAKGELEHVIKQIIKEREMEFVQFFNKSQSLSTRMHSLELLPGLGKKHMWEIVEERRGEDFTSFANIKARVKLIPDPEKLILKRVLKELEGEEKHMLFVH
jgi:putative nucleotide binding protein